MIDVVDVRKNYGETVALRGISTSIQAGEIVGLLGPNGAGKTSLMKILVGYLLPDSGSASVAGHDVVRDPLAVQERIGYLPENAPLYHDMLVQEFLAFTAEMRELAPERAIERIRRVSSDCGVMDVLTRPIGHLSKGYRQRVGLAASLLHDPDILFLDEPTTGLDPNQIVEVRDLIRRMGQTKTVVLSTHILSEVEATCTRAVILIDGQVRADGTLDQLTRSKEQVVSVAIDDPERARQALETVAGVSSATAVGIDDGFTTFRLALAQDREVGEEVASVVRREGWPLRELRRDDKDLEQVFRELTAASRPGSTGATA